MLHCVFLQAAIEAQVLEVEEGDAAPAPNFAVARRRPIERHARAPPTAEPEEGEVPEGCVAVTVGKSQLSNVKKIELPQPGLECPAIVFKGNWPVPS